MVKIVFMGTPEFAVPTLEALLATQTVVGVVTQPDRPAGRGRRVRPSPVKVAAQAADVPIYQPATMRKVEDAAQLQEWAPEAIVVAAYGQILRPHVLDLPPLGCFNVHASLLPRWRGASPIQHAILAGDEESGISLMAMDAGLDTGPVYVQEALALRPSETAETLHDRLAELGARLIAERFDAILAGEIMATPQNDAEATYAPMIGKEDGRISWDRSGIELDRHVRAMTPWPSAFTTWEGRRLKVLAACPVAASELPGGDPGMVIEHQETVVVLGGEGGLRLLEVQPAGKQAMAIDDFLRGRPDFVGSRLGR